jgi:predicted dehydrogenase
MTRIAFVGCGFVADLYAGTLALHPELELVAAMDRDAERARAFAQRQGVKAYESLDALLGDPRVELVVNLTNPESHFAVSKAALEAGRHVYSEKPLALRHADAVALHTLAQARGLRLSAAPCSLLGESAQTLWHALRHKAVGEVRVVYAEMDDGMLHRMPYTRWKQPSGTPWPYRSEFETGCTLEHAGYCVAWLAAFFGPAQSLTAFSACQAPDKRPGEPMHCGPDFSVACITFASGVVARLTCSVLAPRDHGLRVFGDGGVLSVSDTWANNDPVHLRRWLTVGKRTVLNPLKRRYAPFRAPQPRVKRRGASRMDYLLGVSELAAALREGRASRLSPEFCLHVNELVLAMHHAGQGHARYAPETTFEPVMPMPWAG